MKSLSIKFGVILIGLAIFAYAEVWGEDWKLLPPPPSPSPKGDMVINDFKVYPVADIPKPAKGVQFDDPVFHTKITRVIDSMAETGSRMTYAGWCRHDAENADGTMFWAKTAGKTPIRQLWNAKPPYDRVGLPAIDSATTAMLYKIAGDIDPDMRWHHSKPNILYATTKSQFVKYDVSAKTVMVLHDFLTEFPTLPIARVIAKEGGNPSADSRYWAWAIRCYDVNHSPSWWDAAYVVYDKDFYGEDNGKVIATLLDSDPKYVLNSFVGMSPSGNYVLIDGTKKMSVFRRDFSSRMDIPCDITVHAFPGVGYDDHGRETIVWVEAYQGAYWVAMADIMTGEKFYLVPFGKSPMFNASAICFEKPGWAVLTRDKVMGMDQTYDSEVIIVELTRRISPPAHFWRVAHTHVVNDGNHINDGFAKFNKKGTKIFFRSSWNEPYGTAGIMDTYQIDLPTDWEKTLLGRVEPPPLIN